MKRVLKTIIYIILIILYIVVKPISLIFVGLGLGLCAIGKFIISPIEAVINGAASKIKD